MILFRDQAAFLKAKILRDHGMSQTKKYWHEEIGYNQAIEDCALLFGKDK